MARPKQNNNPFALIQKVPSKWQGLVTSAADGFLKFDTPYHGARAGFINLINTYFNKGVNTIEKIFPIYAPAGHGANVPEDYIKRVVALTGIPRNKVITDPADLYKIGKAIVSHEEGQFWMTATDFDQAFKSATDQVRFNSIAKKAVGGGGALILLFLIITYFYGNS